MIRTDILTGGNGDNGEKHISVSSVVSCKVDLPPWELFRWEDLHQRMENYFPTPTDAQQGQRARERVIDDIRALIADGEVLLLLTADDLSRTALNARQGLVDTLRRAKAFIIEAQEHPLESARVVIEKTESTVKKYPFASLAAAFGTGLFLGAILSRQSRD